MRLHFALAALAGLASYAIAQQEGLQSMPRFDRYEKLNSEIGGVIVSGGVRTDWAPDSKSFTYYFDSKWYRYDVSAKKAEVLDEPPPFREPRRGRRGQINVGALERGRQYRSATSPDGKMMATSRDRNVYLTAQGSNSEIAVTKDGNAQSRVKYGVASWVYGEELEARVAMWWSPDSKKLAFYRFDEKAVPDYYVTLDEGKIQDRLDTEPYPKAGAPNPKVSLLIYDVASKRTTPVDCAIGDPAAAEYVYDVRWSDDGRLLFYNRTDRKQKTLQFCAADPATGVSHVIVSEPQPQSWAENHPEIMFLNDGRRFIWASERSGFKNYYLYDLDGRLLRNLTANPFDANHIVQLNEKSGWLFYTCSGPDDPYFIQLRKVSLDGRHDEALTDRGLMHEVSMAPDGAYFTDIAQSPDQPAETRLLSADGRLIDIFAKSDISRFNQLGLRKSEIFTYLSADGKRTLYGIMQVPSDFDPQKKYPVLLSVYAGPESGGIDVRFRAPLSITELGFIVVSLAGEGTMDRGKAFRDAVYDKLGVVEIDDQNAGIRSLASRPYVDLSRVGVFGTSYGGYATIMLMLRHPETFAVGCSSSPVTDWRNYDSIYTERYMGLPADGDDKAGYDAASAMTYAADLKGHLMLYFGSADNNVHPSNTYQLTERLQLFGKVYDMQVGTDQGHSQMNANRMWAYFVKHLIVDPESSTRGASPPRSRR